MLFSSLEFLCLFLPLTLAVYFLSPRAAKNYVLLCASLVFYSVAQPRLLPLLLLVTLADYVFGLYVWRLTERGHVHAATYVCSAAVVFNVSVLFVFKYLDALLGFFGLKPLGIELPVGISFYTFQALSYVIDVRRRAARVQKNPALFLTYVSLFPQLVAGPIVRYCEVDDALVSRRHSVCTAAEGVRLFLVGLCKKILLANPAGEEFLQMLNYFRISPTTLGAYLGLVFFAFQIYFDFSGYSDMARGLGKIFGFEFPENFHYPYVSRSITEFWRRWHVTLSSFFREYVYIPLGGNRRGRGRMYANLFLVWALTGLWHGASMNFLLWGVYFFLLIALEKAFLLKLLGSIPRALSHIYALIFILLGWLIFICDGTLSAAEGGKYLLQLVGVGGLLYNRDALFELLRNLPLLAVMTLAATPCLFRVFTAFEEKHPTTHRAICAVLSVGALIICTAYLASSGYNPFLYFKF